MLARSVNALRSMTITMTTPDDPNAAKLRDPAYFALHVKAMMAFREVARFGWYDSHFLRWHAVALRYLEQVRPDEVERFAAGFAPIRPDPAFSVTMLDDVFDDATCAAIREASLTAVPQDDVHQAFENSTFGRDVVWDEPLFRDLQEQVRQRLEKLAGMELEASYSFLSRYRGNGVCAPHLDHPDSMFTFDYCIDQSHEWPIHFSRVVDWPTQDTAEAVDLAAIKQDASLGFAPYTLKPNQAIFFNGSSQWHYRDPITPGGFCNLLFFHYIPAGCGDLVAPVRWAEHFEIPELEPLCDLIARQIAENLF